MVTVTVGEQSSVRVQFEGLARKWRRETSHLSNPEAKIDNYYFQEIIKMGENVIPFILEELEKSLCILWDAALSKLTGLPVVQYEEDLSESEIVQAWLEWGRKEGLLS